MHGPTATWILILDDFNVEKLSRRDFQPEDAAAVVFGRYGVPWTKLQPNDRGQIRAHVKGPYADDEALAVVVLRAAEPRDLDPEREDVYSIDASDQRVSQPLLGNLEPSMAVPVSMRSLEPDEEKAYKKWRMTMKNRKVKEPRPSTLMLPLAPGFDTDEEEWRFWDRHRVEEFQHVEVPPNQPFVLGGGAPMRRKARRR